MRRQSGWIAGQLNVTNDRSTPPLTQAPEAGEAAAVRYVLVAKDLTGLWESKLLRWSVAAFCLPPFTWTTKMH